MPALAKLFQRAVATAAAVAVCAALATTGSPVARAEDARTLLLGAIAAQMARLRAGDAIRVLGFLNRKNRMSAQLVLHATRTETIEG